MCSFYDKETIHCTHRNFTKALDQELVLEKVHGAIKFHEKS